MTIYKVVTVREREEDLIAVVVSFSGRIHDMRSRKKHKNKKKTKKKEMIFRLNLYYSLIERCPNSL